jgi:Ca2+-binding EF-hand superfamily protein
MFVAVAVLLPALAFAAKDTKGKKRPASHHDGAAAEVLKSFDKNENHQIDTDELPALQKAFSTLKNLDKNANGEIEPSELESLKAPAVDGRRGRAFSGLQKADKNGNRKIDADEIEELQKLLVGSPIMSRLDHNSNGRLDADEVERLNQRIGQHLAGGKPKSAATPPPTVRKAPEKPAEAPPAETPKTEEKKDKPAEPAPAAKPPGNFGN